MKRAVENLGQNKMVWSQQWDQLSPESDIRMWDYFGLRQWILKYTPRNGKILEAGCGLGRYNFYLNKFGIDTIGLDFSEKTIEFLKKWQKEFGYDLNFVTGDVKDLDFESNSLSGYLSFGVVEHFIDGPHEPIREAFRVLRPGGIAIISTPAPSWSKSYKKIAVNLKKNFARLLGRTLFVKIFPNKKYVANSKKEFFQYEYTSKQLKRHIEKQGFYISRYSGADLLYTFTEFGNHTDKYIRKGKIGYKISHLLEGSWFSFLGAQSVVVAIKTNSSMHCFLCGGKTALRESLNEYDVPICEHCIDNSNSIYYKKNNRVAFHGKYNISPTINPIERKKCAFCGSMYNTDRLFENLGFDKNVCSTCLKSKKINILLSNTSIQPIWRKKELK